ncbi:MAG: PAS domain S-box protein [Dehalococcoidia bacterium]|jgi:PAS domain S-box-containing protein
MISALYVDDEPGLLEIGKLFLESSGAIMIDTSASVCDAIRRVKTVPYDAIISDYQMPEMNGIEFLKYIRTHFGDLPFILFTGRGREEVVIEALNSGADAYLQKGGDPASQFAELEHKIKRAVWRQFSEKRFLVFNRLYAILNGINCAITHVKTREELFREVLRIAVETGKFRMAWMGIVDPEKNELQPFAGYGTGEGTQRLIQLDEEPDRFEPSRRAARERKQVICNEIEPCGFLHTPATGTKAQMYRSTAAVPLFLHNRVIGTLQLFDAEPGFFADEEVKLLLEIASDLSFALEKMSEEEQREMAETLLLEKHQQLEDAYLTISSSEGMIRTYMNTLAENQRQLSNSRRQLSEIINFLPDATFAIDTQGTVIVWNKAMETMTGVLAIDIVGKGEYEYALPFYKKRRPMLIDLVLKYDEAAACRYDRIEREGDRLISQVFIPHLCGGRGAHLWFVASPLYNEEGGITGAIESVRDVSEFSKTEIALRSSEERYRRIIEHADEGIVVIQDGVICYSNPLIRNILGNYAPEEMDGHPFGKFIYPADRDVVIERARRRFAGEEIEPSYVFRALTRTGEIRWLRIHVLQLEWNARPAALSFLSDITDAKKNEEDLREAHSTISLLNSITRHEIADRLTVLRGRLRIARKHTPDPDVQVNLDKADIAARDIFLHIKKARFYQEIGTGEACWQHVAAMIAHEQALLDIRQITVSIDTGDLCVCADPLFPQVFFILFDNALRHTSSLSGIRISAIKTGTGYSIIWEDDSTGYAPENKEQIFKLEYGKASGLGLFPIREILCMTGMTIRETGVLGTSCRFEISVPNRACRVAADETTVISPVRV